MENKNEPVMMDYQLVPLSEVPHPSRGGGKWEHFFKTLPPNQAAKFSYNNRQRVYQVRNAIHSMALYHKISGIETRISEGQPVKEGTGKWLLYVLWANTIEER